MEANSGSKEWVRQELLRRRVVILQGDLDDELATETVAQLVALDANDGEPMQLQVTSESGTVDGALALVGAMEMLATPVHVTCLGRVHGAAVAVVAVAAHRRSAPNASFRLSLPTADASGTAHELERWAAQHEARTRAFVDCIAGRTRIPFEHVEADLHAGRFLAADDALRYGLIDEVWDRSS